MKFLHKKITLILTILFCILSNTGISLASGVNAYNTERAKYIFIYAIPVGIIGLIVMIMYFGRKNSDESEEK